MAQYISVRKNAYHDSVTLMTLTSELQKSEGVSDAVVLMATKMNKELAQNIGLADDCVKTAKESDLIIAIRADSEEACAKAVDRAEALFLSKEKRSSRKDGSVYTSIAQAKRDRSELNMAVISVAGAYAAREADLALGCGMNVMLFSDNVGLDDEVRLKKKAQGLGLFVMGPDCGTAIVDGVGLCFANDVRRGTIGIVAASGTGLQEVSVIIDRLKGGISQALGTGGRDLSSEVGGIMALEGIGRLEHDSDTAVIVLVSKPPAPEVAEKLLRRAEECAKPVVICFIGDGEHREGQGAVFAQSLEDAAAKAVALAHGEAIPAGGRSRYPLPDSLRAAREGLGKEQRYIRGLYCGGTLAAEALFEISKTQGNVFSNVAKIPWQKMENPFESSCHTIVDLGDDVFTAGRPHPMIEPGLRCERLVAELADPAVAVVLLDFELGFGSHQDPVGETLKALLDARHSNEKSGRTVVVIGYVLGTDRDHQGYSRACALLEKAGVILAKSNLHATEMALSVVEGAKGDES